VCLIQQRYRYGNTMENVKYTKKLRNHDRIHNAENVLEQACQQYLNFKIYVPSSGRIIMLKRSFR
jgi:hypothetical protein